MKFLSTAPKGWEQQPNLQALGTAVPNLTVQGFLRMHPSGSSHRHTLKGLRPGVLTCLPVMREIQEELGTYPLVTPGSSTQDLSVTKSHSNSFFSTFDG